MDKIHEELKLSQQLFADHALHGSNIPSKQRKTSSCDSNLAQKPVRLKKTQLLESKFRKSRKRRNSGYYSSTLTSKHIKFVGELPDRPVQQNLGVTASAKVSGISFSNLEFSHQSHPNLISKDKYEIMKSFALKVWQLTPRNNSDLVKYALIIDKNHKLSWLDVLTLNPAPSSSMFNAVTVHYGSSGKGWLSKYVVDAYLTVLVRKANQKKNLDYFGDLDCDHSSILINRKPIKTNIFLQDKFLIARVMSCGQTFLCLLFYQTSIFCCFGFAHQQTV